MKNQYRIEGDVTVLILNRKDGSPLEALISTSDLPKIKELNSKWFAWKNPDTRKFYVVANVKSSDGKWRPIYLHRFIFDFPPRMVIDHINHNPLDNRRENLRVVSNAENMQNLDPQKCKSSGGVRGVTYDKQTGKWRVRFTKNNKTVCFGRYEDLEEARKIATKVLKEIFPFAT